MKLTAARRRERSRGSMRSVRVRELFVDDRWRQAVEAEVNRNRDGPARNDFAFETPGHETGRR